MVEFDSNATADVWYPIPSLPGYEISNRYRVRYRVPPDYRPSANPRLWKPKYPVVDGYREVEVKASTHGYLFFDAFRCYPAYIHRTVWEIVHGEKPPRGKMVRHFDDNKLNNHPSNLRIGRHHHNVRDAKRNGRYLSGMKNPASTIPDATVEKIREAVAAGKTHKATGLEFGVSASMVSLIVRGKRRATGSHR